MVQRGILDLSYQSFQMYLESIGEKSFRAQQVFDWIYKKYIFDFDQMKNLSSELRHQLKKDLFFPTMECVQETQDNSNTIKFLFRLSDGQKIEAVLIQAAASRLTVCVSSQAGCKFACKFCASGIGGWRRNLSCGEIVMQVLQIQAMISGNVTNVVFMGTGEPFDNWEAVRDAIQAINSQKGLNIAARRITISTCGIVPMLKEFSAIGLQVNLAISLHGYTDKIRQQLMPINKMYPLSDLIAACHECVEQTKRTITFEYILIEGLTCCDEAPQALAHLLKGLKCKLNLIPYNVVQEFEWKAPSRNAIYRFHDDLIEHKVHATIRWSKGQGAEGACGQLRHSAK